MDMNIEEARKTLEDFAEGSSPAPALGLWKLLRSAIIVLLKMADDVAALRVNVR